MTAITIEIPGEPIAWARAASKGKIRFTPHKQAVAMDIIRFYALRALGNQPKLQGSLRLKAEFFYTWPKSISAKKKLIPGASHKTSRPDVDNLLKILADSFNEILWADDAQVSTAIITKRYADTALTRITVYEDSLSE